MRWALTSMIEPIVLQGKEKSREEAFPYRWVDAVKCVKSWFRFFISICVRVNFDEHSQLLSPSIISMSAIYRNIENFKTIDKSIKNENRTLMSTWSQLESVDLMKIWCFRQLFSIWQMIVDLRALWIIKSARSDEFRVEHHPRMKNCIKFCQRIVLNWR